MFGSITDMISQWEGMEDKEGRSGDDLSVDKRGRKRLSKLIGKLSGRLEEGEEEQISQPGEECGRKGEDALQVLQGL